MFRLSLTVSSVRDNYFHASILSHAAQRYVLGTKTQHDKNHQRGQHRRHEVYARDHEGISVAVVVIGVVGGVGNNRAIAKAQGKKDLCGSLSPHLHITPNLKLKKTHKFQFSWLKCKHSLLIKARYSIVRNQIILYNTCNDILSIWAKWKQRLFVGNGRNVQICLL